MIVKLDFLFLFVICSLFGSFPLTFRSTITEQITDIDYLIYIAFFMHLRSGGLAAGEQIPHPFKGAGA